MRCRAVGYVAAAFAVIGIAVRRLLHAVYRIALLPALAVVRVTYHGAAALYLHRKAVFIYDIIGACLALCRALRYRCYRKVVRVPAVGKPAAVRILYAVYYVAAADIFVFCGNCARFVLVRKHLTVFRYFALRIEL